MLRVKVEVFVLNNGFALLSNNLILKKSRSWTQYWSQKSLDSCLKNSGLKKVSNSKQSLGLSPDEYLDSSLSEYVCVVVRSV